MKASELIKLKQIAKDLEKEIHSDERSLRDKKRRLKVLKGVLDMNETEINKRINKKLVE